MKPHKYPSDLDELDALTETAQREHVPSPRSREDAERMARNFARMTILFARVMLVVDRGSTALPLELRPTSWPITYALRLATILAALVAIIALATIPLLFLDLWAAGALFLVALALVGVIALLLALCLAIYGRATGRGPRLRLLADLTGALGRLASDPR